MAERVTRAVAVAALLLSFVAFLSAPQRLGPDPDAASYVQLAENLPAGDGYTVDLEGEPEGSRYPPGFPLLLVLLSPLGDAWTGAYLLAMAFVTAVWASAWKAGGPIAATVAVLSVALYLPDHPFAGSVMADTTGALFVVLGLLAVQHNRPRLAGLLVGFGAWVRLAHIVAVVGLPRRSWPPFAAMVTGLLVTKVTWGWGYGDGAQWALHHVWSADTVGGPVGALPNGLAYPLMLLGVVDPIAVPGAALLAGWAVWRRAERRFVLTTAAVLLVVYLPYFWHDSRFMFPIAALIAIYSGAAVSDLSPSFLDHADHTSITAGPGSPPVSAEPPNAVFTVPVPNERKWAKSHVSVTPGVKPSTTHR